MAIRPQWNARMGKVTEEGRWDPDEAAVYIHAIEKIRPAIGRGTRMSRVLDHMGLKKAGRKPMLEHCHAGEGTTVTWKDVPMCVALISYFLKTMGHRIVNVYTLRECIRVYDKIK